MARRKRTADRAHEIRSNVEKPSGAAAYDGGVVEYYLSEMFAFFSRNLKETALVTGAVALMIVGGAVYWNYLAKQDQRALTAFEALLETPVMSLGSGAEQKGVERLDEYIKSYPTDEARLRANVYRLDYLAEAGQPVVAAELALRIARDLSYPEQRAYFLLRAGIHYENAEKYSLALEAYSQASALIREQNYPRAVAVFGEARCLMRIGRTGDGRAKMSELMGMDKADRIDALRTQAAAFLAGLPARPGPPKAAQ